MNDNGSLKFEQNLLLPNRFRIKGYGILAAGILTAILRFYYGYKPEILDLKVFAFYSSFLETKFFSIIEHNITDEIAELLLLLGLFLSAFTKEKNEEKYISIRFRTLMLSFYFNCIFLFLCILFVYGLGFIEILMMNLYSNLLFYIIIFKILKYKYEKKAFSSSSVPV